MNTANPALTSPSDYARLAASYTRVCAAWTHLAPADPGHLGSDLAAASDHDLLGLLNDVAALARQVDTVKAKLARAIADRSSPSRGAGGLARATGHRTPADLLATTLHVPTAEATRLLTVGAALDMCRASDDADREDDTAPAPSATAVEEGALGVAYAHLLVEFREQLTGRIPRDVIDGAERDLIALAREGMRLAEFRRAIARFIAHLDPARQKETAAEQYARREFSFRTEADGMLSVRGRFDAEHGAYIRTVIEGYATNALRTARSHNTAGGDAPGVYFKPLSADDGQDGITETRSLSQIHADALIACCQHVLGCDLEQVPGASTTVVVRMSLDDLSPSAEATSGVGELDGGGVIDAGAARRRAAAAGLIPVVLGGASEVLDWGRERRHFTRAQRAALAERDGGCAMCGLPPGMTEAHHLRWWHRDGGKTDLANGVLLCSRCHHLVHEGWEIHIDGDTVWIRPPASVDAERTPRLGGRKRFDPAFRRTHPPGPPPGRPLVSRLEPAPERALGQPTIAALARPSDPAWPARQGDQARRMRAGRREEPVRQATGC